MCGAPLLAAQVFLQALHDPTTRDRQGSDVGRQYRSVVAASDEAQARAAQDASAGWGAGTRRSVCNLMGLEYSCQHDLDRFWLGVGIFVPA